MVASCPNLCQFALHHRQGNAGSGLTYTINSGNSSNFENVGGTVGNDNLTDDGNAKTILVEKVQISLLVVTVMMS